MRIAIATEVHPPKIDGISRRLEHTICELVAQGHEVMVVAPAPSEPVCAGERLVPIPGIRFTQYPGVQLGLPHPRLFGALASFQPDVVHAVGPVATGLWALLAARFLAIPAVASYHTDLPAYAARYGYASFEERAWRALRAIHDLADLTLCPSRYTRAQLVARGFSNVGLWRGGVDPELFHPRKRSLAMRSRLAGGRVDRPLLLSVGRLAAEKSLHTLAPVLDELPGVQLAFVGDGPERHRLENTYRGLPVVFAGVLEGEELAQAFASADAFVMPSTTETMGFAVLEAMASGLPVVAADAGGVRDLVRHDETGLLYDPAESKGALEPIRRVIGSRALAADLARSARRFAERASWEWETRTLVGGYQWAIEHAERRSLRVALRTFLAA
jgi:glycosyltransferase involved in cell wall biosynthesis